MCILNDININNYFDYKIMINHEIIIIDKYYLSSCIQ